MATADVNSDDDVVFSQAMQLASSSILPMTLRAAVELGLFDIMAAAEHKLLSSADIASQITTKNLEAPEMVERILKFLASSSILKCESIKTPDGERLLYGLNPVCNYFVGDRNGVSLAYYLLMDTDKVFINTWYHLKDAILEGGSAFTIAQGMSGFEYAYKDQRFNNVFNQSMRGVTTIIMNKMLDVYKGFEGLTKIIDVGGGTGANLAAIVSKYPRIKGINFDLPHVIKDAPFCQVYCARIRRISRTITFLEVPAYISECKNDKSAIWIPRYYLLTYKIERENKYISTLASYNDFVRYLGVDHVAGDMFESVPSGDAIFLKYILHDWSDDECLKLLRNCWKALPKYGKLIVVETLLPQYPDTDDISNNAFCYDLYMLLWSPGAKERTRNEFDALATRAGFARTEVICNVHSKYVIEFYKM